MPGDYTRLSFDPAADYSRPRAEQGRMLRDAYLNELADGLDHRLRALALDVLGPCTAPLDLDTGGAPEATGFRIEATADGKSFTIGLGRLYLHGLALDNHGEVGPQEGPGPHVEPGLQDLRAAAPVRYADQPYLPNPPDLTPGRHLVYVEAWEREVTAVERPELIDPAIGVETDARMQTVWQVKVLPKDADDVDCGTEDPDIPGWVAATAPSAGRLSTKGVAVPASTDPCSVPPDADYLGWENRLYRVEVHNDGMLAQAGFKWARDNASVAAAVTDVDDTRTVLTVSRTGRDDVQRIREGAWVEVLDDDRELSGTPGFLARVVTVDRLDDPTQQVTLSAALPADLDPADHGRRTRLRQWDHSGPLVGADGTIPVSAATGGLVLEDGVRITFSDAPAGGTLRTGDHWTFTARSADGRVEELTQAPPQGPHRFYGRLAVIDLPNEVTDCRGVWPPACAECGDCTVCVTPESHADGTLTVQQAVDRVRRTGGRVCLAVGQYELDEPVVLNGAQSVTLSGHGWLTVLRHRGSGPALVLQRCRGVTVSDLAILGDPVERPTEGGGEGDGGDGGGGEFPAIGIAVAGSAGVDLLRCAIARTSLLSNDGPQLLQALITGRNVSDRDVSHRGGTEGGGTGQGDVQETAIALSGLVVGLAVRDCALLADLGITAVIRPRERAADGPQPLGGGAFLMLAGFELTDSLVYGVDGGLLLDERVQLSLGATLRDNLIVGDGGAGVIWQAESLNAALTIRDCRIDGGGAGIELAAPTSEIRDCVITARPVGDLTTGGGRDVQQPPLRLDGTGIALTAPRLAGVLSAVSVTGCTLSTVGPAIAMQLAQQDVVIADNRLDGGTGGVVMRPGSSGSRVVVRGNEVTRTERPDFPFEPGQPMVGVLLTGVTDGEVRGNRIHDLFPATTEPTTLMVVGVFPQQCRSVTVTDNILDVRLPEGATALLVAGVVAVTSSGRVEVLDNVITSGGRPDRSAVGLLAVLLFLGRDHIDTTRFPAPASRETLDPAGDAATLLARLGGTGWYAELKHGLAWVTPARVFAPDASVLPAATIRGNRIEADGDSVAVRSVLAGPLLVNDNLIRRTDQHPGDANQRALLDGSADSTVVSANHLETSALTAVRLDVPANRVAVTGNVVKGAFLVGGQALQPPWAAINVAL
ncbi:parallel beta helix pectate lyase-like protein [Streptomyces sp. 1114.5]|uniref:DUF6519 domain-containing protein n=1 Tax=Streptomyces sp. 1114.5 TaxID=1938830 RepID=UPI000EAE7E57|nr:DUF6519 domain-containing protein [Streptomyces sp. 1114.5]RKT20009.1 parallel beta helix pectate lyase-like protein [Streptomyces sp. 1114.5]